MSDRKFPSPDEDQALRDLFAVARDIPLEPSPFLATRVLAHLKSREQAKRKLRFWQALSVGLASAFVLTFVFIRPGEQSLEALINKPHVVMVKLENTAGIASAEIDLPEGVYFYSESIPSLKEQRALKLSWTNGAAKLPFVVKSDHAGSKTVKVRFRGTQGEILVERLIQIQFVGAKS